MADLDTRSKRASSVGLLLPFLLAPPLADGTLGQGDRQHKAHRYSGIAAATPPSGLAGLAAEDVAGWRSVAEAEWRPVEDEAGWRTTRTDER